MSKVEEDSRKKVNVAVISEGILGRWGHPHSLKGRNELDKYLHFMSVCRLQDYLLDVSGFWYGHHRFLFIFVFPSCLVTRCSYRSPLLKRDSGSQRKISAAAANLDHISTRIESPFIGSKIPNAHVSSC